MSHVEINAPAIKEESAVASGFIPPTRLQIDQAVMLVLEQPVPNPRQDFLHLGWRLDQTTVLSFETGDAL